MDDRGPDELEALLHAAYAEIASVAKAFTDNLDSESAPPLIYHYTDDNGLRGILDRGTFWLTDIFDLNDPSELKHGIEQAIRCFDAVAGNVSPEQKFFAEMFSSALTKRLRQTAHYFVFSLSKSGKDLGQWRAYADNGRGYALAFDGPELEKAFGKSGQRQVAFPVTYDDNCLFNLQAELVKKCIPLISIPYTKGLPKDVTNNYLMKLSARLGLWCLYASLFFKHEAYKNEQEYRFLEIHPASDQPVDGTSHRNRRYSLVRYREFDWKRHAPNSLKQVIVGPAANREMASKFATDCVRMYLPKPSSVTVAYSDIPYRAH